MLWRLVDAVFYGFGKAMSYGFRCQYETGRRHRSEANCPNCTTELPESLAIKLASKT